MKHKNSNASEGLPTTFVNEIKHAENTQSYNATNGKTIGFKMYRNRNLNNKHNKNANACKVKTTASSESEIEEFDVHAHRKKGKQNIKMHRS